MCVFLVIYGVQVYFTSGTTGAPKMVGHTHSSYGYCHRVMGKYWLDLTRDDIMWNISDTGWAKGRVHFSLSLVQIHPDTVLSLVEPYYAGAKVLP